MKWPCSAVVKNGWNITPLPDTSSYRGAYLSTGELTFTIQYRKCLKGEVINK